MKKNEAKLVKIESIDTLYQDACQIIENARSNAVRSVDFCRVQMYWNIGKRIFEEEQQGKERAEYGKYIIKNLSKRLTPEYGSGFSVRQLEQSRQFYRTYPIANTVRSQLNWSQYRRLIQIEDPDKREYYELESVNNAWTARETERQINSMLYERLLMSNDKESVLAVARKQKLQMYVNYYDRIEKLPDENPTIGILLCTQKNDTLVRMTLPENNKTILASEYRLYLPTTEQLVKEVDTVKKLAKQKRKE